MLSRDIFNLVEIDHPLRYGSAVRHAQAFRWIVEATDYTANERFDWAWKKTGVPDPGWIAAQRYHISNNMGSSIVLPYHLGSLWATGWHGL